MSGNNSVHSKPGGLNRPELITTALISLGKLLKAVGFYPAGHPALEAACDETRKLLKPLLQNGNLVLTVRKAAFCYGDEVIGADVPVLQNLAFFFFARLVHRLLILPELTARDLGAFARCAISDPAEIQRSGGLQELLLQAHVTGLFLNETDLQTAQAYRERMLVEQPIDLDRNRIEPNPDQPPSQHLEEPVAPDLLLENLLAAQLDPEDLLFRLEKERSDQRHRLLCQKLVSVLPEHLHEPDLATPCKALLLLARHGADESRNNRQRRTCLQALDRLGRPEFLRFFIDALCDKRQSNTGRNGIVEALTVLQDNAVSALIARLAKEENSQARKLLSDTLVRLGDCAVPALVERLPDDRWYVCRNAIAILGRIRSRKAAVYIRPYIDHRDYRVRREAVRALGRIGGPVALKGLLQLVTNRDRELCSLALIALGAMKNDAAVEPLLKLLRAKDPLLKQFELTKGAIKALGTIGSPLAVPLLTRILQRRRLWKRTQNNVLRSYAAQALSNIADEDCIPILEAASKDSSPPVAHAASEALEKISARTQHEP